MEKKHFKILTIFLLLISFLSISASAENIIDNALKPFKDFNIAETYSNYFYLIDFILFLMFFLGVARFALEKKFEGKSGMWIIRIVGIMMALGVSIAEKTYDFNLGKLNPLWLAIFFAILIFMLYKLFQGIGISGGKLGTGIIFLVTYWLIYGVSPKFGEALTKMPVIGPWIYLLMQVLLIVGIVFLIMGVIGLFKGPAKSIAEAATGPTARRMHEYGKKPLSEVWQDIKGLTRKTKKAEKFVIGEFAWLKELRKEVEDEPGNSLAMPSLGFKKINPRKAERKLKQMESRIHALVNILEKIEKEYPEEKPNVDKWIKEINISWETLVKTVSKGGVFDTTLKTPVSPGQANAKRITLLKLLDDAIKADESLEAIFKEIERLT